MMATESAPSTVIDLVELFERTRDGHLSDRCNETREREDFLDSFFETLGWDVQNKQGLAEAYRDVIPEDSRAIDDASAALDLTAKRDYISSETAR